MDPRLRDPIAGGRRRAVEDAIFRAAHASWRAFGTGNLIPYVKPLRQVSELPIEITVGPDMLIVINRVHAGRIVTGVCLRPADRDSALRMLRPAPNHGY